MLQGRHAGKKAVIVRQVCIQAFSGVQQPQQPAGRRGGRAAVAAAPPAGEQAREQPRCSAAPGREGWTSADRVFHVRSTTRGTATATTGTASLRASTSTR